MLMEVLSGSDSRWMAAVAIFVEPVSSHQGEADAMHSTGGPIGQPMRPPRGSLFRGLSNVPSPSNDTTCVLPSMALRVTHRSRSRPALGRLSAPPPLPFPVKDGMDELCCPAMMHLLAILKCTTILKWLGWMQRRAAPRRARLPQSQSI
jgi:hypothetical protein